ncbi:hypothetical protein KQH77_11505 [Streptococcus sanguinis]|jgi:hypothetical protein|uniref:hypothetical protein n=1 Tax=Streptococcus sanguinis TaxID=1305 RepID=UPI000F68236F|nr:hypothetical protein [Streptococcus sanguinis]
MNRKLWFESTIIRGYQKLRLAIDMFFSDDWICSRGTQVLSTDLPCELGWLTYFKKNKVPKKTLTHDFNHSRKPIEK